MTVARSAAGVISMAFPARADTCPYAVTEFNLIPQAPGLDDAAAGVAAVRTLLTGTPVA